MLLPESPPVHRPLGFGKPSHPYIRLLTIHPRQWSPEMRCTLSEHSLPSLYGGLGEPATAYSALSYVWGSPKVKEEILLNDRPWHVTVNLSHALHFLREEDKPVLVWIDALVRPSRSPTGLPELTRTSASTRTTLSSAVSKSG